MSKNISKFKFFFGIIIFGISIIALIISYFAFVKKKFPKILPPTGPTPSGRGTGESCSPDKNECQGDCVEIISSSSKGAGICMPSPEKGDLGGAAQYINVGDPIFIKSKNTNEDLWINSKSDPLLTTCKNLKDSAGLTISYGWPACTDPGTKSTVTIGSDGLRTGEGCQVMATPYCVKTTMGTESELCNDLDVQRRRLGVLTASSLAPPDTKIAPIKFGSVTLYFLWTMALTYEKKLLTGRSQPASWATRPPSISRVKWVWPSSWKSRWGNPFRPVWVYLMDRNCALSCFISNLEDCKCYDRACWDCAKAPPGQACQQPTTPKCATPEGASANTCAAGTYGSVQPENMKGYGYTDDQLKPYCRAQIRQAVNKFLHMVFKPFRSGVPPGMTQIATTERGRPLYLFSELWRFFCQHFGIVVGFPYDFAPFINPYSTEYFVEYGPNKGGGKPSAPPWEGDEEGDPFPFDAGEGTDFLTWFNTWVERRLTGIGGMFFLTPAQMQKMLYEGLMKNTAVILRIMEIYNSLKTYYDLVNSLPRASLQLEQARSYQLRIRNNKRLLQQLWVELAMAPFQNILKKFFSFSYYLQGQTHNTKVTDEVLNMALKLVQKSGQDQPPSAALGDMAKFGKLANMNKAEAYRKARANFKKEMDEVITSDLKKENILLPGEFVPLTSDNLEGFSKGVRCCGDIKQLRTLSLPANSTERAAISVALTSPANVPAGGKAGGGAGPVWTFEAVEDQITNVPIPGAGKQGVVVIDMADGAGAADVTWLGQHGLGNLLQVYDSGKTGVIAAVPADALGLTQVPTVLTFEALPVDPMAAGVTQTATVGLLPAAASGADTPWNPQGFPLSQPGIDENGHAVAYLTVADTTPSGSELTILTYPYYCTADPTVGEPHVEYEWICVFAGITFHAAGDDVGDGAMMGVRAGAIGAWRPFRGIIQPGETKNDKQLGHLALFGAGPDDVGDDWNLFVALAKVLIPDRSEKSVTNTFCSLPLTLLTILLNDMIDDPDIQAVLAQFPNLRSMCYRFWAMFPSILTFKPVPTATLPNCATPSTLTPAVVKALLQFIAEQWTNEAKCVGNKYPTFPESLKSLEFCWPDAVTGYKKPVSCEGLMLMPSGPLRFKDFIYNWYPRQFKRIRRFNGIRMPGMRAAAIEQADLLPYGWMIVIKKVGKKSRFIYKNMYTGETIDNLPLFPASDQMGMSNDLRPLPPGWERLAPNQYLGEYVLQACFKNKYTGEKIAHFPLYMASETKGHSMDILLLQLAEDECDPNSKPPDYDCGGD